jgi:hypothetical protein
MLFAGVDYMLFEKEKVGRCWSKVGRSWQGGVQLADVGKGAPQGNLAQLSNMKDPG